MSGFPVKAVIFDWAGTMVDFGCMAPVRALRQVFAGEGVALAAEDARADMGRAKLDHLRALLSEPGVAARWRAAKGAEPGEADVARLYEALGPAMTEAAAGAAKLIPGAASTVCALRKLGVRIGSGTGYTRAMMGAILSEAERQGYVPDVTICAGETPSGRPSPQPAWAAMIALDVWSARACIKVDDAAVGMAEGKAAGCWTVGVAASGNEVGLDAEAFARLSEEDRRRLVPRAAERLKAAGADYVIDDVSDLLPVVHEIAARIAP